MNRLNLEKRTQILSCLVEGNSIRSTEYQNETFRNLSCKRIQVDEIWPFCYSKQKNVPKKYKGQFGYGDVWTWTAICADTKLVPSWLISSRDAYLASIFLKDLASMFKNRVQSTTDGYRVYLEAVENALGLE